MSRNDLNRQVLQLLETLYDGVATPEKWPQALRQVGAALGGQGAAVITHHGPSDSLLIDDAGSLLPEIAQGFQSMNDIDPARAAVPLLAAGQVYIDHEFHGMGNLQRMPFYGDFLHPLGVGHYALLPAGGDEEHVHVLSVQREHGRHTFSAREGALMRAVQPHLRHALALRRQLEWQRQQVLLLEGMLDALSFPLLVCSAQGRMLTANAAGRQWLMQSRCPLVQTETLPAAVRRVLERACGYGREEACAGSMQLPDGDLLIALPFVPAAVAGSHAQALVAIQGVRWRHAAPGTLLRALFGLTPAEIRLVQHLMLNDDPLTVVAGQMQLSLNTLRTQLKAIFQKTHTRRQADLLRLVGQLGGIRPADRPG